MSIVHLNDRQCRLTKSGNHFTNLGSELEARNRLIEVRLKRTDHDEHERLRIASKRVLQEVRQLSRSQRIRSSQRKDSIDTSAN